MNTLKLQLQIEQLSLRMTCDDSQNRFSTTEDIKKRLPQNKEGQRCGLVRIHIPGAAAHKQEVYHNQGSPVEEQGVQAPGLVPQTREPALENEPPQRDFENQKGFYIQESWRPG